MSDQNDQHALAEGRAFPWHELYAPNIDQALQFYVDALGFGITEMDMGTGTMYKMLTVDGKAVAGSMDTNSPDMQGVPPHWSVFMSVDDVDARLAKCLELGGEGGGSDHGGADGRPNDLDRRPSRRAHLALSTRLGEGSEIVLRTNRPQIRLGRV